MLSVVIKCNDCQREYKLTKFVRVLGPEMGCMFCGSWATSYKYQ